MTWIANWYLGGTTIIQGDASIQGTISAQSVTASISSGGIKMIVADSVIAAIVQTAIANAEVDEDTVSGEVNC